jgi:RNA polymerase sigma-70 factor (ECF subfamily)
MPVAQASQPLLFIVGSSREAGTDVDLVGRTLAGDGEAATALWDRYIILVRTVLRRALGAQDVDDISQEVFLGVYKSLASLREGSSLRSFIIGVTLHYAGTELRRRRARAWLRLTPTGSLAEFDAPACDDPEGRSALRRLYGLLDRLDTRARLAFVLRYMEGMELTEIAEALEISLATTKRLLGRASGRVFAWVDRDAALSEYLRGLDPAKRKGAGS